MIAIRQLTDCYAVSAAPPVDGLKAIAAQGFVTVIDLRTEAEGSSPATSANLHGAARAAGLIYIHIPATKHDLLTDAVLAQMSVALQAAAGPVLAVCASGQRAAIVWAAATARREPVENILATLARAGFDLAFLRDDLDAQADRQHWNDAAPLSHAPSATQSQVVAA